MFQHARVTPMGVAVGVIATLVIGGGTAVASTGRTLLMGKTNKGTHATVLTNTKGTPLSLVAKKGKPPLKVNTYVKVAHLNADQVDGRSATAFARAKAKTGVVAAYGGEENAPGAAYTVAVATCPTGTVVTGGGGFAMDGGSLFYSGPGHRPNSWEADSDGDGVANNGKDIIAYAVCYNSQGAVKGALSFPKLHELVASLRAQRR